MVGSEGGGKRSINIRELGRLLLVFLFCCHTFSGIHNNTAIEACPLSMAQQSSTMSKQAGNFQKSHSLSHGLLQPDGVGDGDNSTASTSHEGNPRLLVILPVDLSLTSMATIHSLCGGQTTSSQCRLAGWKADMTKTIHCETQTLLTLRQSQ